VRNSDGYRNLYTPLGGADGPAVSQTFSPVLRPKPAISEMVVSLCFQHYMLNVQDEGMGVCDSRM
jgi:hypothetical protein